MSGIKYFNGYVSIIVIFTIIVIIINLFQFGLKNSTKWKNTINNWRKRKNNRKNLIKLSGKNKKEKKEERGKRNS